MPRIAEIQELLNKCSWVVNAYKGVKGMTVTGQNGNSIFLPAGGYRSGTSVSYVGSDGRYWSSSLYESTPSYACSLYFNSGDVDWDSYTRDFGRTVRAVCP